MKRELYRFLFPASLALAAAGCAAPSNGCNANCPVGCDISEDCASCIPESAQAGLGTSCNTDEDCCNGTCISGTCTADGLGLGGDGGTASGSGGTTGAVKGTSGGSSSGGSKGTTGGSGGTCPASPNPSLTNDAQCSDAGVLVCDPQGECVPNCNDQPEICATGQVCEVNGHCETPGGSGSGGSAGNGTAGNGSAGSAGTSAGTTGATSAGSTSSGTASSSSSSGSTGGGSTGGGTSAGSSAGCGGSGQEYDSCTSNAGCACPYNCVADGTSGSFCLQPCTTYTDCQLYEVCDATLSPQSCNLNYCSDSWGACTGADDSGGSETGTCNPYPDGDVEWYGICFAGGTASTSSSCNFNATYSTAASAQCAPGDFCGETVSGVSSCYQGCDPTGQTTATHCAHGLTCYYNNCDCSTDPDCDCGSLGAYCDLDSDPNACDPYFGYCD